MAQTSKDAARVALVTGGGSGIGRATALRLVQDGTKVLVVGRRAGRLQETVDKVAGAGGEAASLALDATDVDAGERAVDACLDWAGRLDILINAAGIFPGTAFAELTDREWNEALAINLAAPMRLSRAAVPELKKHKGAIVNVSSTNAVMGDAYSICSAYAAAKAGLLGLTRQIAAELAPEVRVNAVLPGPVATPMLEGWNEDPAEMEAWLERYVPLRRVARPEDIASVICFLAGDGASYITGAIIPVDGGMTII
jgi:meso-butanediol dehydrogenase / (S,S)-butanediol dehydrogenase / diacetyl reductase